MHFKKYLSFFNIRFSNGLQYRMAAYAGIATQFAWGIMEILLFSAFYKTGNTDSLPMEFSQLSSYVWLQQAFLALFMTWFLENDIFNAITNGNVAYELCRPLDLYNMWFVKSMANRLSKAVLRCMPILIIAVFLPKPYNINPPPDWLSAGLFVISMTLGFLVVVAFCMLIYICTFFTISPLGVRIVAISMVEFFSGSIVPLPFLPDRLRYVMDILPFASMQNMPLRIYSGNVAGKEALYGILLQLFWTVALIIIGKSVMAKALKRVVIQGG